MAELTPEFLTMPSGEDKMRLLGLLAHVRYQQITSGVSAELGVTVYEPIFSKVCHRGVTFDELPPVFQHEFLAEAGINPDFAAVASPLLPAIRAVTFAVEQGISAQRINDTILEAGAA